MKIKSITILLSIILLVAISGCDPKDGTILTEIEIPLGNELNLFSANEGIYPDTSVLDDPENPYADASLNEVNVWDFDASCPSPKAKFYLWATMLAKMPQGQYQFKTAEALHKLYTAGSSLNAKEQAKKAYRATLDHFFNSAIFYEAWWLPEEQYYGVLIRDIVGKSLYDPTAWNINLLDLYDAPGYARVEMTEWGYIYDPDTGTISIRD